MTSFKVGDKVVAQTTGDEFEGLEGIVRIDHGLGDYGVEFEKLYPGLKFSFGSKELRLAGPDAVETIFTEVKRLIDVYQDYAEDERYPHNREYNQGRTEAMRNLHAFIYRMVEK